MHVVEVAYIQTGYDREPWQSGQAMELETEGIVLALAGSGATVRIAGRLSPGDLWRIMAACEGDVAHAPA